MSDTEPFVPDHIKAKQHTAAVRERRGPVPHRIEVELPIERQASATDCQYGEFQPEIVQHQAVPYEGRLIVTVTAIARDPFRCQSFSPNFEPIPDWVTPAPAWFTEQVARMRRRLEDDRWIDKRADMQADVAAGLA